MLGLCSIKMLVYADTWLSLLWKEGAINASNHVHTIHANNNYAQSKKHVIIIIIIRDFSQNSLPKKKSKYFLPSFLYLCIQCTYSCSITYAVEGTSITLSFMFRVKLLRYRSAFKQFITKKSHFALHVCYI